eukprot:8224943-Pyramimonas_sp.AAC.2
MMLCFPGANRPGADCGDRRRLCDGGSVSGAGANGRGARAHSDVRPPACAAFLKARRRAGGRGGGASVRWSLWWDGRSGVQSISILHNKY